jgi:aryl-alcohol dehydrogenase-like predicted oxidoreductase
MEDLKRVKKIFLDYSGSPYSDLSKIIKNKKTKFKKIKKNKLSKILLGTVQIGKKYFQKNIKISQARANNILNTAIKNNINFLDTAFDYGNSEKYIGNYIIKSQKKLFLCSKLKNLRLEKNCKHADIIKKINFSIFESLNRLKSHQMESFFVHNSHDLFKSKIVYNHLIKFLKCRIIKNLGVSIYKPSEFKKIKEFKQVKSIQLPFNLIDHRWIKILNKKNNLNIFARSLFLRGNLRKNKIIFPKNIKKLNEFNKKLRDFCKKFNKKNFYELTLAYLKSFVGINFIVIGAQNSQQVKEFQNNAKTQKLNNNQKRKLIEFVKTSFDARQADLRNWN